MTDETSIDWTLAATTNENVVIRLAQWPMDAEVEVTFSRVFQSGNGAIGAEVTMNDPNLEGNVLWLSGEYGPSNGFLSLQKAAGNDPTKIEGATFVYVRVASERSKTGYAHSWRTL